MELNEQDISLIDQYLEGTLTGEPLTAFRKRMEEDSSFRAEVQLQADVVAALKADGRTKQKTQLSAIQAAMIAAGEIKPYTPTDQGGGGNGGGGAGSSFFRWLLGLVITGAIVTAVWYFIKSRNGEDGGSFMNIFQQTDTSTTIRRDTIRGIEYINESDSLPRPTRKDGGGPGTARPDAGQTDHVSDVTVITKRDTQFVGVFDPPNEGQKEDVKKDDLKPEKGPTGKIGKKPDPLPQEN